LAIDEQLAQLLDTVDIDPGNQRITIHGADPVYSTQFRIGEAAAVANAACGVAAAEIWSSRGGRNQTISIGVREAAAALGSYDNLSVTAAGGVPIPPHISSVLGTPFQCKDGRWIKLVGALPHFEAGTLGILGCDLSLDAIAAAVAGWKSEELESSLATIGMPAAVFRTPSEWLAHPQGRILAAQPEVQVTKISDGPAHGIGPGGLARRPLQGVRGVDLTRVLAGPSTARILAALGASVMHVAAPQIDEQTVYVVDTGHGKFSCYLDLNRAADLRKLRALIMDAHVVVQNFRATSFERRGFGADAVAAMRPGIIYANINCYGFDGPWVHRRGYEPQADASTGLTTAAAPTAAPHPLPVPATDYTTGSLGALGVLAALIRQAGEGGSYRVDASLARTAMWIQSMGTVDPARATGVGSVDEFMIESETAFGRLRHFRPSLQMDATPLAWTLPPVPLGTHEPTWPPEGSVASRGGV